MTTATGLYNQGWNPAKDEEGHSLPKINGCEVWRRERDGRTETLLFDRKEGRIASYNSHKTGI